jgi:hypothetical protein
MSGKPLPPGIPLDEDIFDGILQLSKLAVDAEKYWVGLTYDYSYLEDVGKEAFEVMDIALNNIVQLKNDFEQLYMEVLFRWIKNKKVQISLWI